MNRIRLERQRPTVALVLSGGGAKGSAHIGAKKYLDELGIPIDMICGTSMGSMMGGLMSVGYDTAFLDSLLKNQDWKLILSDMVDQKFFPYETKIYNSQYQLRLPFHYRKGTVSDDKEARLKLQATSEGGKQRILSSLIPSGYINGFNINNFLSSLTVGYQDDVSFADLPIPFFCVATDMVSCKARNYGSGSLKTAMRASMSIPGLFNPVRSDNMVLVDGGTRNNFPTDLAKSMGADIIIGVELSDSKPDYSQINNLKSLFDQFISMLGQDAFIKNVENCDVYIKPKLDGYGMLSFNSEAIDTLIDRGYRAAKARTDDLMAVKRLTGGGGTQLKGKPATDLKSTPVQLSEVSFKGLNDKESRTLMKKIGISAGQFVDKDILDKAMSILQGSGVFESVTYSLIGREEPYKLVFDCSRGPVHRVGIGLRADTEEWAAITLNLGLGTQKLAGSTLNLDTRLGINQKLGIRYSLKGPGAPTLNLETSLNHIGTKVNAIPGKYAEGLLPMDFNYLENITSIYISHFDWSQIDLKVGFKNTYDLVFRHWIWTQEQSGRQTENAWGNHLSAFGKACIYSLNDRYYPTNGLSLNCEYDFRFQNYKDIDFEPVHTISLNFLQPVMLGARFAMIPELHARFLFGNNPYSGEELSICDAPAYINMNYIGGAMAGRYVRHQIPFAGLNGLYSVKDKVVSASLGLRFNPWENWFITGTGAMFKDADTIRGLADLSQSICVASSLEVGYNSILGPLKLNIHWSTLTRKMEGYLSLGFEF